MSKYIELMKEYKSLRDEFSEIIESEKDPSLKVLYKWMLTNHKVSSIWRGVVGNIADIKAKIEIIKRKRT